MLSSNDSKVLGALFDPEASLSNVARIRDSVPEQTELELRSLQSEERDILQLLNEEDPSRATVSDAIKRLDDLIERHPTYASAWNNRAQARRMLLSLDQLSEQPQELRSILDDLAHSISLASPASPDEALSAVNARVLASAHTHRGFLLLAASKSEGLADIIGQCLDIQNLDKALLEEMASRDFAAGGRYGNDTARQMAVRTNPYAKLCGSIVKEAVQKEIRDYHQTHSEALS